jgi:hypothetical protein
MRSKSSAEPGQELEPAARGPVSEWAIWTMIGSGVLTGASATLLLWVTGGISHKDALDVGMKVTLAAVGLLGVILGVRRYNLAEKEHDRQLRADQHVRSDALARQITDLSAKASEQLGSDKAAVRLGGITDLERLAHSYPDLRQTVIDRLCAYLRGPFTPPADILDSERSQIGDTRAHIVPKEDVERRLELGLRRMAQKIIHRHLRWPMNVDVRPAEYWEGMDIDLSDATLVEFILNQCRVHSFTADGATFHGPAIFDGTRFESGTWLPWAKFKGQASFIATQFPSLVSFHNAEFHMMAMFDEAAFGRAIFDRAIFVQELGFHPARFDFASFTRTIFQRDVSFSGDVDGRKVRLDRAEIPTTSVDNLPPGWTTNPISSSPERSVVVRPRPGASGGPSQP